MRFMVGLVLAVMLALPVAAQDRRKGVEAYERGDYATALRVIRPLAEQGDADAQSLLGVMYTMGWGVKQNFVDSIKWHRKAAEQWNAHSSYLLGVMYVTGEVVPPDFVRAAMWQRIAAELGYGRAQFRLGFMYYEGKGVPQDHVHAYMWYSLAAAQGHKDATKSRDLMAQLLPPAGLSKAKRLAREWLEKHGKAQ